MTQLDLPPAAHRNDPATSHLAAAAMDSSGARMRQVEMVANLVKAFPWSTSAELAGTNMARVMSLDRAAIARRLPDAEKRQLVTKGDARICREKGTLSVTWGAA